MNDQTGLSKNRVETLTDDIFAVAMTLLVLDISVPQISSNSSPTRIGKLRSREGDDAADIPYINPPLLAFVPATWTINKYTGDVLTELHFNIIETEEKVLILNKNTRLHANILDWDQGSKEVNRAFVNINKEP